MDPDQAASTGDLGLESSKTFKQAIKVKSLYTSRF